MKNLRLRLELLFVSLLVVYGGGCGCETIDHQPDPWCYLTTVNNMTDDLLMIYTALPGEPNDPNSNYAKAQSGVPINLFDPTTSRVLQPHESLSEEIPIPPGAQGVVVGVNENGETIPDSAAGIPARQAEATYDVFDFQPTVEDNPYFIRGGGGPNVP